MLLNVDRARSLTREAGYDGIISATLENNFYLSGSWLLGQELFPHDSQSYVVATTDAPDRGTLVCSIGEADLSVETYDSLTDIETYGTFFRDIDPAVTLTSEEESIRRITEDHEPGRPVLDAISAAIEGQGLAESALAVDERGPDSDLLAKLAERFPSASFAPASMLFRSIRAVKTPEEVERVIATLRVTEAGFNAAVEAFAEGVSEAELKNVFERTVVALGAKPGFCLVRIGAGMALGQVPAGDTKLQKGDFAFFDIGVNLNGYKSDIGRLVSLGEPGEQLASRFAASLAGQQTAIDMLVPGSVAGDVFDAAVATVRETGIPEYQRQHVGHGVGVEYYDMPVLSPGVDTVLEAGMTFEVETPYYELGTGGSFIEDTVLVTDQGPEILTTLPREIVLA